MYYDEPKGPKLGNSFTAAEMEELARMKHSAQEDHAKAQAAKRNLERFAQIGGCAGASPEELARMKVRALEQREKAELAKWEHEQKNADVPQTLPATEENFLLTMLTKDQLIHYIKYLKGQV